MTKGEVQGSPLARVAILGTGLIGTSVGLALKQRVPELEIVGWDITSAHAARAAQRGALDQAAPDPATCLATADVVVLATPVDHITDLLHDIAPHVPSGTLITDVGSSKASVVQAGERIFGGRFLGGHPMAGSERHGPDAADAALFEGASWILTPTPQTDGVTFERLRTLVSATGATPVALPPEEHDQVLAALSHVPQVAAAAVVLMAAASVRAAPHLGLAGGGFRDVTRIAQGDPLMWLPVLRTNRKAMLEALGSLVDGLENMRSLLETERWDGLKALLEDAREVRTHAFAKSGVLPAAPLRLSLLVPDRPGILAEVTTTAGEIGANIEDLQIYHSTEGGRGRLELVVAGENAPELEQRLESLGYHVDRLGVI